LIKPNVAMEDLGLPNLSKVLIINANDIQILLLFITIDWRKNMANKKTALSSIKNSDNSLTAEMLSTICRINKLKEEKNATILVHNYQPLSVQSVGDIIGDSLQLAQEAAKTNASIIVMCGVKFMAETAKLLSPQAKVLLSHEQAGCPMADMITAEELKDFKKQYPNSVVVCYVNSSVEVKAESDICCTSSNAEKIVNSIPTEKQVLFVPDQNLGHYVAKRLKRKIIVWKGYCNVHHQFITSEDVDRVRKNYPGYKLLVHPECRPEIIERADVVASTKGIADYVAENDYVIIGTEVGLWEQLKNRYPDKHIQPLTNNAVCVNMKKGSLFDVQDVLEQEKNEIFIDQSVAQNALESINRMLAV